MEIKLSRFTEKHAKEICLWKYDNEYSIYNYPDWNTVCRDKWAITIDEKRNREFLAVIDEKDNLCGYIRLQIIDESILIGLGLKPRLCGHGLGVKVMELIKKHCSEIYKDKKLVLEVRTFNIRAVKCYKNAGFSIKDEYEKDTLIGHSNFYKMEFRF